MEYKFKVGDKVICINSSAGGSYTKGRTYIVSYPYMGDDGPRIRTELDDKGSTTNGWGVENFKLTNGYNTPLWKVLNGE